MRSLTLLELMVEWDQIPHDHFLVVRDVPAGGPMEGLAVYYNYQRGCVDDAGLDDIKRRVQRSADQMVTVSAKLPAGVRRETICSGCRGPLGYHFTEAQKAEIVDDALAGAAFATGT